ncbi:MAG TPA: CpsB/CapC family capsule biosynthesis tyrosine phosphatase [Flavisolibacter sp.]|nr:CpsB/CapC family capsule biosynthesis tyrosine phosphatase [Flavisolibacter sp.]
MFFSRKKSASIDLSWLGADMHSHFIPGIDDGSRDMDSSLQMIRGLADLGYKKIITTPHVLWDLYPNTPEIIGAGLENLTAAVQQAGIGVSVEAAAEYFIDDHFSRELRAKAPLLPISANMVLVEFSMITASLEVQEVIFDLQMQNYQPVIAHPERYAYLTRKRDYFDDLKFSGCYFQLNLLSLAGHYGTAVQELAEYLMKKNYYDLAGTDMHNTKHLEALRKLSPSLVKKLQDSGSFKNHLL